MEKQPRQQISQKTIDNAVKIFKAHLQAVLKKKGFGTFASRHEILGVLHEEYNELEIAVRSENEDRVNSELLDIGVVTVFGLACSMDNALDW